jgi:flavin reductase (DIM6/NTAB) family NADH-FMN oxidoreductase RutF
MVQVRVGEVLKHKYPEWIDLVVSRSNSGKINVTPVGWSMIASGSPHLYAVAISSQHYTAELIQESGEFVVAAPGAAMAHATYYCGAYSGRDRDKVALAELQLMAADMIETPLLKDAVYNLECRLHSQVRAGDHILFIGEIVAAHLNEEAGPRLLNFGDKWASAQPVPGTEFVL